MDALILRSVLVLSAFSSAGAVHRTPNFVVNAPTPEFARAVGEHAEHFRHEIAVAWLDKPLPKWYKPCQLTVKVGQMGSGGATTFAFDRGEVFGWRMEIQGSEERILDSVLPHEVSHTIFACHFRRPLPRWADEGAATLVEHESEKRRQQLLCRQVLGTGRRIPLRKLLSIREYPRDMQDVLTLYAEGYSLADFLVQGGGKTRYLRFLEDAHQHGWDKAVETHYGFEKVEALEQKWNNWIIAGSPPLNIPEGSQIASASMSGDEQPASQPAGNRSPDRVVRGQSPRRSSTAEAGRAASRAPAGRAAASRGAGRSGRSGNQFVAPNPRGSDAAHEASVATLATQPRRPRSSLTLPVVRMAATSNETTARREQPPTGTGSDRLSPAENRSADRSADQPGTGNRSPNAQWSIVPEETPSRPAAAPARLIRPKQNQTEQNQPDPFESGNPEASLPREDLSGRASLPAHWPGQPSHAGTNQHPRDNGFPPDSPAETGRQIPAWSRFPSSGMSFAPGGSDELDTHG